MIFIAHRGLFEGPDKQKENTLKQIDDALSKGFDVEIDVRMHDGYLYLGHDEPTTKIDKSFINSLKNKLWVHCKNVDALSYMIAYCPDANYFWHDTDDYTLTSKGYVWCYPGKRAAIKSIAVMPEMIINPVTIDYYLDYSGVCSDFVSKIEEIFQWV